MDTPSDQTLITQFIDGNHNAFRLLTERYQQQVYTVCIGFTHDSEDAQDISQEVFIETFRSLPKFRGQSSFSTWLYRIAVTKSLKFIQRNRYKKLKISLDFASINDVFNKNENSHESDYRINRQDTKKMLKKALWSLPKKQRVAFVLNKYKELTNKEIADVMAIPQATVDTLIHRARKNLKQYIIDKSGKHGLQKN